MMFFTHGNLVHIYEGEHGQSLCREVVDVSAFSCTIATPTLPLCAACFAKWVEPQAPEHIVVDAREGETPQETIDRAPGLVPGGLTVNLRATSPTERPPEEQSHAMLVARVYELMNDLEAMTRQRDYRRGLQK